MTTEQMTTFFALLAVLTIIAVVAMVALYVASPYNQAIDARRRVVAAGLADVGFRLAWLVALVATVGSLYLSEVAHYTPCKLCWYQRIAMYPLVLILGVAAWRRDRSVRRYAVPLAVLGGTISIYHYVLQRFPNLTSASCDPTAPCTSTYVWKFHFLSIPLMALCAFTLIVVILMSIPPEGVQDEPTS